MVNWKINKSRCCEDAYYNLKVYEAQVGPFKLEFYIWREINKKYFYDTTLNIFIEDETLYENDYYYSVKRISIKENKRELEEWLWVYLSKLKGQISTENYFANTNDKKFKMPKDLK